MTADPAPGMGAMELCLSTAVAHATEVLAAADVATPAADARWLVMAASGHDPRRAPGRRLDAEASGALATMLARRTAREPLQLIVGSTAFRTLELTCAPGVFIPRPETEVLAGLAIDHVRRAIAERGGATVVEPCCGTGAVSLAIAAEVVDVEVHAADLSPAAVELASRNRDRVRADGLMLARRVDIVEGDLLAAFDVRLQGQVDVLVANPPYLPLADGPSLPPEVDAHDPHTALFGGVDGHEVVDALLAAAPDWLAPGGTVLLELDARRGRDAVASAERAGLVDARLEPDLSGALRFLVAHRAPEARR
jgi:release factor glutamine methyltransferase